MSHKLMKRMVGLGAIASILAHLTASVLQNTPDSYNQDLRKFTGGWTIPGWRFFAPNPGIQNVHLLIRESCNPSAQPGQWRDITPQVPHGWIQILWNPSSRGPKALFDALQQLTVMNLNYAELSWVTHSVPYSLISSTALSNSDDSSIAVQFMMMNYIPSAPRNRQMQPILVSDWLLKTQYTETEGVKF